MGISPGARYGMDLTVPGAGDRGSPYSAAARVS